MTITYDPADPNMLRHALQVHLGEEWSELTNHEQDLIIEDLQDILRTESFNIADTAVHVMKARIRPARLKTYAETLVIGELRRLRRQK